MNKWLFVCTAIIFYTPLGLAKSNSVCQELAGTDFTNIIQGAPTLVTGTEIVKKQGDIPEHCVVDGSVAPEVGFKLGLPVSKWNGKFLEFGCGGFCQGDTLAYFQAVCRNALSRGYACAVHDGGHQGRSFTWANSLQMRVDYGYRAAHVVAVAGKAIAQHFYDAAPKYAYFMGCSGGGRQALIEAQDFPWDFDGIVAEDPSAYMAEQVTMLWNDAVTRDKDGKPLFTNDDLELLNQAAVAKCDLDDGIKDGVISHPPSCQYDPESLVCKTGEKSDCLSPEQALAAQKVYNGPTTSKGERLPMHYPSMPGAESGGHFAAIGEISGRASVFRFLHLPSNPGPKWSSQDFDFDNDYKHLGLSNRVRGSTNPDLRHFKARGGKIIITQGWHDSGTPLPLHTADYYETVERVIGGRAKTQEFARLFMIPGRAHCGHPSGPGVNIVDTLTYLEDWVEKGSAPDLMIGTRDSAAIGYGVVDPSSVKAEFTRPLYPYPIRYQYKGKGDPRDYRSYRPVKPGS